MAQINNIFNFLKDYNELSNPVVTEIEKQKWNMYFSDLPKIKEIWSVYENQDFDSLKILEVRRPILEPCPIPDEEIIDWIDDNWKSLSADTVRYKEILRKDSLNNNEESEYEEKFSDSEKRLELFEGWIKKRDGWRNSELPKQKGLDLYNNLFKLYSDIKKESESVELILGEGYIHWSTDLRLIDHPVLLQSVQLEFNPDEPAFILKCDELKTELYTPMLRVIPTINQSMLSDIIQEIEINIYHIADIPNIEGLFKRLINVIDENGKCVEIFDKSYNGPMIMSNPVLFLRKRTLGYSMFIDRIIEEIESNVDIIFPDFFENMVGNHKEFQDQVIIAENWNQNGIDEDVLLTLPANNEQLRIIKYLNNYGAVLVQGPPGTGKTHTIANLIGHLLSQGNSVLVTSHTEKALTVLKEKVYKDRLNKDINLQSLCISLLSSSSQKKEMDDAINEIATKSTSLDLHESKQRIERLGNERNELINKLKTRNQELLQIRSLEYKDIVFSNQTITPIEAAKFIKSGIGKFDYITGATSDDTIGLPLSIDELDYLYKSNKELTIEEEQSLNRDLPTADLLWSVELFEKLAYSYSKLIDDVKEWNPRLIIKEDIEERIISKIQEETEYIHESILNMNYYQIAIINKTIKDGIFKKICESVFEEINDLLNTYEMYRKICFDNDYYIPENRLNEESINILNDIIGSKKDNPLTLMTGLIKPKWKKFCNEVTNRKKAIGNKYDLENVKVIIQYELNRINLISKVNKLLSDVQESELLSIDGVEEKIIQYQKKIRWALNWYNDSWLKYINNLCEIIIEKQKLEEIMSIEIDQSIESIKEILEGVLIPEINNTLNCKLLNNLTNEWAGYIEFLNKYNSEPLIRKLISAANEKNIDKYKNEYDLLMSILNKDEIYTKRYQLLENLKSIAPVWANSIMNREGMHGKCDLPENIELAWKWCQLNNQIDRINEYDANIIQKEIRKLNERLMDNARKLAYEKAWYKKISQKTAVQTQAIEGWRKTIKQIGKGTGKNAPALLKKARELMPLCQTAIPVWIMPLNRVVDNFDPLRNKFDVVIIDEASQADILALSVLYLAKKVIIVGDDEQVSPDTVGMKNEEINALIEQHLKGIPNNHLFNGKTSVYDMAQSSGFKPLMLTEHFRCLPEIIEFSNQLSYNGRIKPLRDSSRVNVKPAVIECRIPNAYKTPNKVNEVEARHIASLICACVENEAYDGKTFGIISLLGHEQAYEIDKLLQINLDPKDYEERRIQCGTPSQFQGDERDVIFLSIVEGPCEKGGPVRLLSEDGRNDITRKKYNVAASRAKDQMWVVHSLNPEIDLKPEDIRLRLIKHAINPTTNHNDEIIKIAESDFEEQVMNALLNKGFKVIPQWEVGAYRIDMVIEDGDNRIALECDGEKWHTQDDLPNDLKRQAILERLGWKFLRIRGSAFYRNPEVTMKNIFEELENMGIKPNYLSSFEDIVLANPMKNELIENIKRRAEQILSEWNKEGTGFINNDNAAKECNIIKIQEQPNISINENIFDMQIDIMESKQSCINSHREELLALIDNTETKEKQSNYKFDFRNGNKYTNNNDDNYLVDDVVEEDSYVSQSVEYEKADNNSPRFDFRKR